MPELKFRAWRKPPYDPPYMVTQVEGEGLDSFMRCFADSPVIMQYIGLKDANGVDIYEGDIICHEQYPNWEWRGVIKFSHGVFGAEFLSNVKTQSMVGSFGQKHNLRKLDDDLLDRYKVIGNIYENPELLEIK